MQGELDFSASLIERVALLQGLNVEVLDRVYAERLKVNKLDYLTTHTSLSPIQCGGPWWLNELGSWIT
jgi:phosphoserine phosphatase